MVPNVSIVDILSALIEVNIHTNYLLVREIFLFYHRNQFTCSYLCNGLDELCSNFVNTLTTENCKTITNNGQGLVKTSSRNKNAVLVWSNQEVQKGL